MFLHLLVLSASVALAAAARPPCKAPFNNATLLETPCYAVVRSAPGPAGGALELRRYAGAEATVVQSNASAAITTYQEALEMTGFYILYYFTGPGNARNESLLASRTVPLTPSQWPAHSHPPPVSASGGTLSLAPLGRGEVLVASLHQQFTQTPQPSDYEALCASLASSLGLLGAVLDPDSVYSPTHAYYAGRADIVDYYDAECWLGVTAA
jgi:hypothetical protein